MENSRLPVGVIVNWGELGARAGCFPVFTPRRLLRWTPGGLSAGDAGTDGIS